METKDYEEIQDNLRDFQYYFPQIQCIYTMAKTEKPNIWKFVVDATVPRDENEDGKISTLEGTTPLGEEFDSTLYPELQKAFEEGAAKADKYVEQDKWGWWLSAYAPIRNSDKKVTAILGVDVSAKIIQQEKDQLKKRILLLFGFSVIISLIISAILSNFVIKSGN